MLYAANKHMNRFNKAYLPGTEFYEDPTYLGFNLLFYFNNGESPLFNESTNGESAIKYLRAIGFPERAEMLIEFKTILKKLVTETPYYIQSLAGMDAVWNINWEDPLRTFDMEFEFETLETIDLKMSYLIYLYNTACFDTVNMREIVPKNLRKFRFIIYVSEMRKLHTLKTSKPSLQGQEFNVDTTNSNLINSTQSTGSNNKYALKELKDAVSVMAWDFTNCEFNFNESFKYLGEMTNNGMPEMATQSFKIKPGFINERATFRLFDTFLHNDTQYTVLNDFGDKTTIKTWEDQINPYSGKQDELTQRSNLTGNALQTGNVDTTGRPLGPTNAFGNSPLGLRFRNNNVQIPGAIQEGIERELTATVRGALLGNVYDNIPDIGLSELNAILGNAFGSNINFNDLL